MSDELLPDPLADEPASTRHVWHVLERASSPLRLRDLEEVTDYDDSTIYSALATLCEYGLVERTAANYDDARRRAYRATG